MFKHLGNGRYLLPKETVREYKQHLEIIKEPLLIEGISYNGHYEELLDDTLLTRIISNDFIKKHKKELLGSHHIIIAVPMERYSLDITIGNLGTKENPDIIIGHIKDNN